MSTRIAIAETPPLRWGRVFGPRRLLCTAVSALALTALLGLIWQSELWPLLVRVCVAAGAAMVVFGVLERWPRRLPRWLARWVLQVAGVAAVVPVVTFSFYVASTPAGMPPFWEDMMRLGGFAILTLTGMLLAPWVALAALLRQREAFARHQATAFALERSELERQALDARLQLLQAQMAPHFLFNTLANIRALVDTGSPRASAVLGSLIAYLRASVVRLHERGSTLARELELVRAYLELMHMRMPDRLSFELRVDPAAEDWSCPALVLLTLVENAVRHGIDPSEEGGHIRIEAELLADGSACRLRVSDTGLGLGQAQPGLGTGLATLRERLRLAYGPAAQLDLRAHTPRGVCAEVLLPAASEVQG